MALFARLTLLYVLRTRFFWVWNGLAFLMIMALHHVTFFDFEGDGATVNELFLATVLLSGTVSSLVFYLNTLREIGLGRFYLLATRPITPGELVSGKWGGLMIFQVVMVSVLAAGYSLDSYLLNRPSSPILWEGLAAVTIKISLLSALFSLISLFAREFWAFLLMVGGFLLGNLSEQIQLALPPSLSHLGLALFCLLPDLNFSSHLGTSDLGNRVDLWATLCRCGYIATYLFTMYYISILVLRRKAPCFKGHQSIS